MNKNYNKKPKNKNNSFDNKKSNQTKFRQESKVDNIIKICGKNSVLDAYNNGFKFDLIRLAHSDNKKYFNDDIKIEIVDKSFLDSETRENHQGFVAYTKPSSINYQGVEYLIKHNPKVILVLDHIQDPHNLGAIIRTANAAGVKHIILPKDNCADLNATAIKISSGGFVGMNFYKVNSLSATLTKLKKSGYWVYATTLNPQALPHIKVTYNTPLIIVVGNEGDGVSKSVLSVTDQSVYIEQFGSVQSLNVSVATGIVLFDAINKLD
ncbi:23S rRNA (guanosine(2251)-2'-O)-methyltransferase RlmB [Mycoplasma sp. Pen4]|uniref:23S rRNA (guanosine(2251)-2'-O)-methyltransferase RlmB n=1 Tax=Mycoplasma sp. Pen4 TaxID=640330 RepID=UPI0016541153|nr:23S rRNA (guanosine(2251)-2'-O)-methyltransferase RlmB [Mycoplasma sp. Pen4]QNM93358.1 23S rRNA (guanosine(2251)-2'-O)-methyltransferase RlmB [Mycoplasma sp. Pen4]